MSLAEKNTEAVPSSIYYGRNTYYQGSGISKPSSKKMMIDALKVTSKSSKAGIV